MTSCEEAQVLFCGGELQEESVGASSQSWKQWEMGLQGNNPICSHCVSFFACAVGMGKKCAGGQGDALWTLNCTQALSASLFDIGE